MKIQRAGIVTAEVSDQHQEVQRRRAELMAAAQAGDWVSYEKGGPNPPGKYEQRWVIRWKRYRGRSMDETHHV
jgi:hypothetical protein